MFYIEKNDKPNFIERKLGILKIMDNTIKLPITEEMKEKKIEKLAIRTNKMIERYSKSKKVVISKELKEKQIYINYLNTYGIEISDGKWLFEYLLPDITQYIINKKQLEKVRNINTNK